MTQVLTHRGLDPSRAPYFPESSREAFADQLERGFGIEFDVRPDMRVGHTVASQNITLKSVLSLISQKQMSGLVSALHLKYYSQSADTVNLLLDHLKEFDVAKFIIFDITIATAQHLREKNPKLQLALSVAHPFDIERYNDTVGGTLYTVEDALAQRSLIGWVWLDEWDTRDRNGMHKKFYTQETVTRLRDAGLSIALVTPELHATSPGLLGGENHADARTHATLMARIREILALHPDAVCTDYPDEVRAMIPAL